jgi:hypothetical protein
MPRPERSLDPLAGPVQAFAADLRRVREQAGSPKYLQMARATSRSRTALSEAAGGDHLPTWETVEAYLTACGQNPDDWQPRWEAVRQQITVPPAPADDALPVDPFPAGDALPADLSTPVPPAASPRRRRWPMTAMGGAVIAVPLILIAIHASGRTARPDPTTIVVQNKIATGSRALTEDTTPVYLSSRPAAFCSEHGCEVPATTMWSGAVLHAICQSQGEQMTNANTSTAGIQNNPNTVLSTRWYLAQAHNGSIGYISEVYLTPSSRGGLGLPTCAPE